MTTRSEREVEAKYRVHSPFQLPDLVADMPAIASIDGPSVRELRAVYWDTSDLRLAREGITLRHRTGEGAGDGWHLKLPTLEAGIPDTSIGARDEIHAPGVEDVVPEELRTYLAVYLRAAVVGPVATLVTRRSSYCLRGHEGQDLAELTDDAVSVLDQGHVAGRFREIEIEDRGGGVDVLRDAGQALRAAGAVAGEFVPKVVRALGPQATAQPDPPPPGDVSLKEPARAVLQAILRRYVRNFMARDVDVRRGQPDGVHQMRVAARRIRSALKTFHPVVVPEWAEALRDELAWVADGLGVARDAEVMLARLLRDLDALPAELVMGSARARVEAAVGGDLDVAKKHASDLLDSDRYIALVDRLVEAGWDPMTTPAADAPARDIVPKLIGDAWAGLDKRATRLSKREATDEEWHKARIAAKQVRYAAEAVAPFYGKPAARLAKGAEAVQELLGEHQDAVVAADVVRRLATAPKSGSIAFTMGLLYAQQQDAIARTRRRFPSVWSDASEPKLRDWLTG